MQLHKLNKKEKIRRGDKMINFYLLSNAVKYEIVLKKENNGGRQYLYLSL